MKKALLIIGIALVADYFFGFTRTHHQPIARDARYTQVCEDRDAAGMCQRWEWQQ